MKLRTRLFLWIGLVFFFFATISYFIESYLTHSNLAKAKKSIKQEIQKNEEEKRKHFESLSRIVLTNIQAKINALLYELENYPFMQDRFLRFFGSWEGSAKILMENKWVGFIQNVYEDKATALIIPNSFDLKECHKKTINEDLAWIFTPDKKTYIAIHFSVEEYQKFFPKHFQVSLYDPSEEYFFYDPDVLKNLHFQKKGSPIFSPEENVLFLSYQNLFLEKVEKAKKFLKTIYKIPREENFSPVEIDFGFSKEENKMISEKISLDHVMMQVWRLSTLLYLGIFNDSPLNEKAPMGVASFFPQTHFGNLLFSRSVFFSKKLFEQEKYFKNIKEKIPLKLSLIHDPEERKLFISNSLRYEKNSFLTIGVGIEDFLQKISLASNQYTLLVRDQKVMNVFSREGEQLKNSEFYHIDLDKMEGEKGFINLRGQKYYFLHLQPFKEIDLHFYLCNLEENAFSFVYYMAKIITAFIKKISYSMRTIGLIALFIALFLLHNISKKITEPISILSKFTEPVARGEFDKVKVFDPKIAHSLEIRKLCESFIKMVQQLKEKEKMRGVLNKVVSKEIAEEILKGSVHLGGEEKTVTILFADIRGFTHITEKMPPVEVIELLNTTMTTVTQAIEKFNGVIDKYVGDEVMALFGAPLADAYASDKALLAASAILENLEQMNEKRKTCNLPMIEVGIGIHTGVVLAGNMGAEDRLNYTVLGANVNIAARLCSAAKAKEILVTKATLEQSKQNIQKRVLDPITLKGFSQPIDVYCVQSVDREFAKKFEKNG